MEPAIAIERLQQLLKLAAVKYDADMPEHQGYLSGSFWWAKLVPIDICLDKPTSTNLAIPSDAFNEALAQLQIDGLIGDVICSPGEPHADDDILYIPITESGLQWLVQTRVPGHVSI